MLDSIKKYFNKPDADEIMAYQYKVPRSIFVNIEKTNYGFTAYIKAINDIDLTNDTLVTEATTKQELVSMVNDLVYTYLEFPESIKDHMPWLLPPEAEFNTQIAHSNLVFAK